MAPVDKRGFIRRQRPRVWWLASAFACGWFLNFVAGHIGHLTPPAADVVCNLFTVRMVGLGPHEQWIKDYDVYVTPVQNIPTTGNYLIMTVIPRSGISGGLLPAAVRDRSGAMDGYPNFALSGTALGGTMSPVYIDPHYLLKHPGMPEVMILNFASFRFSAQDGGFVLMPPAW
jgi:hypothetical protein